MSTSVVKNASTAIRFSYEPERCQNTPSSNGFHYIRPRTRAERKAAGDKELLEKRRLADRREGFLRYDPTETSLITTDSAGYIDESDRFNTDVASEELRRRQIEYDRKQAMYDASREKRRQKDEERWQSMEEDAQKEEEKWNALRGTSRSNVPSMPYDLISQKKFDNEDGKRLADEEDRERERARMRADRLKRLNSGAGYNPITGEQY